MLDGQGARDGIEERCNLLRESIERTKSDYEKEKLQERLAKLHSGVAVIKVGFFFFVFSCAAFAAFVALGTDTSTFCCEYYYGGAY